MKEKARTLRKRQTNTEKFLWHRLRSRQLAGCKFRRQFPIGRYIVDFVCLRQKLIIELDGGQHTEAEAHDATRTAFLEAQGFTVLRFWNNEIFTETDAVLQKIFEVVIKKIPPHPDPLPQGEREQYPKVASISFHSKR